MVTEIKYANRTGKVEFGSGKSVDMTYNVQVTEALSGLILLNVFQYKFFQYYCCYFNTIDYYTYLHDYSLKFS